ncbi:MAG: hypothetical protein IPQ07_09100 [Myxococcales bacterium]|nr:hypothetical protein [Myxococcales bacterium]
MPAKLGVLVGVLLSGCGTERSPVEKCDDLIDTLCDRGVQCIGGAHVDCVQAFQRELPCGAVKAVSASYDRCIDQIQAASCGSLFPLDPQGNPDIRLPADCQGAVLSRTSAAPTSTLAMPRWGDSVAP